MQRRAIVLGAFDMLHVGHVRALRAAALRHRDLVVLVADDALVARRTGRPPMVTAAHRAELLAALDLGTVVVVDDDDTERLRDRFGAADVVGPDAVPVAGTTSRRVTEAVGGSAVWDPVPAPVAA